MNYRNSRSFRYGTLALLIGLLGSRTLLAAVYTEVNNAGAFTWNSAPWNNGIPNGVDNGTTTSLSGLLHGGGTMTIDGSSTGTTPSSLMVGWSGDYNLSMTGGTLNVGNSNSEGFAVGESGNGVFTQTNGTVTADALKFARLSGTGIYNFNGGLLVADSITKGGGSSATFNIDGGTIQAGAGGAGWFGANITTNIKAGGAIIDTQAFDLTVDSALLDGGGGGGVTVNGTGVYRLNAAGTYTGPTTINTNFLVAQVANAIPNTLLTLNNSARFDLFGFPQKIAGLAGVSTSNVYNDQGATSLEIALASGTQTFDGTFSANNFSVTKSGGGTQVFTGSTAYTGTTNITGGILQLGAGDATLNDGASNFVLSNGSKLVFNRNHDLTDFSRTVTGTGDVELQGQQSGYYRFNNGTGASFTNTGKVIVNLTTPPTLPYEATLYFQEPNRLSTNTELNMVSGTVQVRASQTVAGVSGSAGTVSNDGGASVLTVSTGGNSYTYSSTVSGNLGITKSDAGTQILSGTLNYTGTTTVTGGTLQIGNGQASTALPGGDVSISAGAAIVYNRNADGTDFTTQGFSGAGDVVLRGQSTGYFRMNAGYTDTMAHTGKTIVDYDPAVGGTQWFERVLWLEKDNVAPSGSVLDMQSGKIYMRNSNGSGQTFAGVTGNAGTFINTDSGVTQKFNVNTAVNQTYTYSGTIGNDGTDAQRGNSNGNNVSFTKLGLGTQILAGSDTYNGTTTVTEGKLLVNGTHTGAGAYTVQTGGTLGGTGLITTAGGAGVTVQSGGSLSPGASIGTLSMTLGAGSLDISGAVGGANTGELVFELGSVPSSDKVLLNSGTLNIGVGQLAFDDFSFSTFAGFGVGVYTLFDTNSSISGSLAASGLSGLLDGFHVGTLSISGNGQDVLLTVVPEPTSFALLLVGCVGIWRVRRLRIN